MPAKRTYHVYVVELSKRVWTESTKFRDSNPQFNGVLECLYVGMTSKTPKERFNQHKTGAKSKKGHNIASKLVMKYGLYLRPSLYEHLNPLTKAEAIKLEIELGQSLRKKRYAVWWN